LAKSSLQKILINASALLGWSAAALFAASLGGATGAYLREPVGATAFTLGGARSASPTYLCSWWNPAALSALQHKNLALGVGYRPLGRAEGYLSFEFPIPPRVGMGLSVLYRGILLINDLVDDQEYPIEDCSYSTYSFKVGLSYLIRRNLQAGLNISIYHQSLPSDFNDDGGVTYSTVSEIGGIDCGVRFVPLKKLAYGFVLKNLLGSYDWAFKNKYGGLDAMMNDTLPAVMTLGQEMTSAILGKPFIWTCDLSGYFFNGFFRPVSHIHLVVNNGFEWQRWEQFHIRAGIRDITFNRDFFTHASRYWDRFSAGVSIGFMVDLTDALRGKRVKFNYGLSTDKAGAGLDQQLDFIVAF
jgi:hypothetical protein